MEAGFGGDLVVGRPAPLAKSAGKRGTAGRTRVPSMMMAPSARRKRAERERPAPSLNVAVEEVVEADMLVVGLVKGSAMVVEKVD